jgi:hypothetical protein
MEHEIPYWHDGDWNELTAAIYRQKCILLLGPDASLEEIAPGQQPGEEVKDLRPYTEILANELARDTGEDLSKWNIDINDLPQVSQYYQVKSRMELEEKVIAFYTEKEEKTSQIHKDLALLPFYLIITTTFDNMFFNALKEQSEPKKRPIVAFHNFKRLKMGQVEMGTVDSPLIYQLYGSLQDPDSLIITENDFLEFLVNAASGVPILEKISSELINEDKCLLFLGFGFRHWYWRVLLHVLSIGSKRHRSFALERIEPKSIEEITRANLLIQYKGSKIKICNAKLTQFAAELAHRYQSKYPGPLPPHPPELLEKPIIFISYVRENEGLVRQLQKKLRNNNLDARIDLDFLETAEKWEEKIGQRIKEFDYFIFALSHELLRQPVTFVWNELRIAQKRQKSFKPRLKFIIPIRLDDCDIPQDFSDLHVPIIDINKDPLIKNLAKTIKRDFQQR